MTDTKQLADKIVHSLREKLSACDLPAFKSIYVAGSYCRGDWLNSGSDLDIHMINNDEGRSHRDENLATIQSVISSALDGRSFLSHCPGGIDYGFNNISDIPKTIEDARRPSPYAPFSTLLFDFKENNITIYGENINELLPEAPDPKACAKDWFHMLASRIQNAEAGDFRLPFSTYKAIIAAQLHFGEKTVNKYKMLALYQKHVPDFPMKYFGELVIRNYLGSIYPERPPMSFDRLDYLSFIEGLRFVLTND
jgi:predicted nucleotidyltransferase